MATTTTTLAKPIKIVEGNLLDFDTHTCIWQFNLSDFDVVKNLYAADSIELLKKQGINFEKNRREGIDYRVIARLLLRYGIVYNRIIYGYPVNWITFHSDYDFGYLIKLLIYPNPLPTSLEDFCAFRFSDASIKHMMKFCKGLFGGLDKVGKVLGDEREVGTCHQARSDSLLTMNIFVKISNYGVVVPITTRYEVNVYPFNYKMYKNDFPVYSYLIN
ncbi:hypothetical protein MKX01_009473 [Papaver californicum]|nr:hypothetical protein MKX01_009473 [Papaver californicum]